MSRRLSVDDWLSVEHSDIPDGSWLTMMSRVASFHHKHRFSSEENHGHDMGFRIALTVEELKESQLQSPRASQTRRQPRS